MSAVLDHGPDGKLIRKAGVMSVVIAGGVESMSRWNLTAGSVTIDGANPALSELYPTVPQGVSADLIAAPAGSLAAREGQEWSSPTSIIRTAADTRATVLPMHHVALCQRP